MSSVDYTQWPGLMHVVSRLARAGVTLREENGPEIQAVLDGVVEEVEQETKRQFVAGPLLPVPLAETRYYDGSGSPEMEVDEMVTLIGVAVIGLQSDPGYALDDARLTKEQGLPQTRLTLARGSVPAFAPSAVYTGVQWIFPAGRQNIAVTGQFGFGATIPAGLWDAVCAEMAVRLASEAIYTPSGRLIELREGDEAKKYALDQMEALGWHRQFTKALKSYRRPNGRRLRNLRPKMI